MTRKDILVVVLTVCLCVTLTPLVAVERGFVYCPAYPCTCESRDGALIINCQSLYLSSLPKFLSFEGRIKELSLRDNSIRSLPAHGFQGLHIEKLDLLDNAVTSIHADAFSGLGNSLQELYIQLYAYNGIPTQQLSTLHRLETLVIIGCRQKELKPGLFHNLSKLEKLHLIGCRISQVKAGTFASLSKLRTLILSHNSLRHGHLVEINHVGNLVHLDLSSNDIHLLDNMAFSRLSKLQILKIAFNDLVYVAQKAFYNLDFSLEILDLHGNSLKEQALASLEYLKILRQLNVASNNISSLSDEYFTNLRYLTSLDISLNEISLVERQSFLGLSSSLQELDLHGNPLELIEKGAFSDLKVLQKLNINNTRLGSLLQDGTFDGISPYLRFLDASNSNLVSRDIKVLEPLFNLTFLDLSRNQIMSVEFLSLKAWHRLKFANFSYNIITEFPVGNLSLSGSPLSLLDLSWNKIHTIRECAFFAFQNLRDVRLAGNPLNCACTLVWMHRWLRITHSVPNPNVYQWTCAAPTDLKNKPFLDLETSDFKCPKSVAHDDKCLVLFDRPEMVEEVTTMVQMLHLEPELTCGSVCMDISVLSPGLVQVCWQFEASHEFIAYNVILKRFNDSLGQQSITVPATVTNHTFAFDREVKHNICVEALAPGFVPVVTKCRTVGGSTESYEESTEKTLHTLIHNSFLPLLFVYICGSLAFAFLVACIIICVRKRRKKPRRIKPLYLAYPAWLDHRSSVSSSPLTHDPHFLNTMFGDDLNRSHSNFHSQSTLFADRLNSQCQETSIPRDTPSVVSSRRESSSSPVHRVRGYACSTLTSPPPHLAMEILAGRSEVDDEFFFHF